jgi:ABC-2 type transport system ATP-binding protein
MITVEHLTRTYRSTPAVQDVSFTCAPGTVTGFLGPNGAGKSTTLRTICGLALPTSGRTTVTGVPYRELPDPGRVVGTLLDASAQHGGRTGRETLRLAAMVVGVGNRRVEEVLELVGLTDRAPAKRVAQYSLGMRQRLGLAAALLGDPQVLVLDEPANGLDPEGIRWMRGLLRGLADRGGTVLLSSHLLREVEAVADQLVVITGGRVVASGRTSDLVTSAGTRVRAADAGALGRALAGAGITSRPTTDGSVLADADAGTVGRVAAAAGLVLLELGAPSTGAVEDLFLTLTRPVPTQAAPATGATQLTKESVR